MNPLFYKKQEEEPEEGPAIENLQDALARSESLSRDIFDGKDVVSKKIKDMDGKERFLINAYARFLKFFSEERFNLEKKKTEEYQNEMALETARYFTKCKQNRIVPVATEIYRIIRGKRLQEYAIPDLRFDQRTRSSVALVYARKTVCLYHIIMKYTSLGRNNPSLFPPNDFVAGAIEVLENGIEITHPGCSEPVVILEKDDFLRTFPLTHRTSMEKKGYRISLKNINKRRKNEQDPHQEEEYGEYGRRKKHKSDNTIKKVGRKGKNSNRTRTLIEKAIMESVISMETSPEMLKLENVSFDAIDRNIFYNLNSNNHSDPLRKKKKIILEEEY